MNISEQINKYQNFDNFMLEDIFRSLPCRRPYDLSSFKATDEFDDIIPLNEFLSSYAEYTRETAGFEKCADFLDIDDVDLKEIDRFFSFGDLDIIGEISKNEDMMYLMLDRTEIHEKVSPENIVEAGVFSYFFFYLYESEETGNLLDFLNVGRHELRQAFMNEFQKREQFNYSQKVFEQENEDSNTAPNWM